MGSFIWTWYNGTSNEPFQNNKLRYHHEIEWNKMNRTRMRRETLKYHQIINRQVDVDGDGHVLVLG